MSAKVDVLAWGIILAALGTAGYFGFKAVSNLFGGGGFMSGLLGGSEGVDLLGQKTNLDVFGNIPVGTQQANLAQANTEASAAAASDLTNFEEYKQSSGANSEYVAVWQRYEKELTESEIARLALPAYPWSWTGKLSADYQAKYATYLKEITEAQQAYAELMATKARLGL